MAAFKGVWIAAALFKDKRLTDKDRLLYSYMTSFPSGDFFASDSHIAETLGWPHKTVRNVMSRLRKLGYVEGRKPMSRQRDNDTPQMSRYRDKSCPASGTIDKRVEKRTEEIKVNTKLNLKGKVVDDDFEPFFDDPPADRPPTRSVTPSANAKEDAVGMLGHF